MSILGKKYLYIIVLCFVFVSLFFVLFPAKTYAASYVVCDISVSVDNNTGIVTLYGYAQEQHPERDTGLTTVQLYDSSGTVDLAGQGDITAAVGPVNVFFQNGTYRAYVDGTSTVQPGGSTSSCSTFKDFTVSTQSGTIYVNSKDTSGNNISTSWTITGPANFSGSGPSGTYPGEPVGNYSIGNIPSTITSGGITYTLSSVTSSPQYLNDGSYIVFDITYSGNTLGDFTLYNANVNCSRDATFNLSWSSSANATSYDVYKHAWSTGAWQYVGSTSGNNSTSYSTTESKGVDWYFKITAKNNNYTKDSNTIWGGNCPVPTVDIKANSSNGPITLTYNTAATLSWTSSNASICTASNAWSGSEPLSGSQSTGNLTSSKTYTLTCTDAYGGYPAADSVVINVSAPPTPTVTISASPTSISWNGSSTLTWSSTNTTSCTASGDWSGSKALSGSQSTGNLTQAKTYSYTLSCIGSGGTVSSTATVVVSAPTPTASNITITQPNYCISGPAVTVRWVYSDPSQSPQSAYQVQISNTGNFSNPIFDSGKIMSNSDSSTTDQGILQFNTTYRAQVRVWNGYDVASSWSATSSSWKTPTYAYPQVGFTWSPNSPPSGSPVQFTDQTVFNGNTNNRSWSWLFGDGGTSSQQNPQHTYSTNGTPNVTLTATDSAGQSCSISHQLNIQKPIPQWIEIAPQ